MKKSTIEKIINLEHDLTSWNKKSNNFKGTKFNGKYDVSWREICFAGKDAPNDPRTGKAKCIENVSYISIISLFADNWKDCMKNGLCSAMLKLGGKEELQRLEAGPLEEE